MGNIGRKKIRKKRKRMVDQMLRSDLRDIIKSTYTSKARNVWWLMCAFDDRCALFLKNLAYWATPNSNGKPKGGYTNSAGLYSVIKSDRAMGDECPMPVRYVPTARNRLVVLGYIVVTVEIYKGSPTTYYVVTEKFVEVLKKSVVYLNKNPMPTSAKEAMEILEDL